MLRHLHAMEDHKNTMCEDKVMAVVRGGWVAIILLPRESERAPPISVIIYGRVQISANSNTNTNHRKDKDTCERFFVCVFFVCF